MCLAGITFTLVRRQRKKKRARERRAQAEYEKEHALQIAAHKAEETMAQALLDQANALELKIKKRAMAYPENWSVSCMRAQHSVVAFFWMVALPRHARVSHHGIS